MLGDFIPGEPKDGNEHNEEMNYSPAVEVRHLGSIKIRPLHVL